MKTNKIILPLITSLILASCGGGDKSNDLGALKQKQADLKTELASVAAQISKLEGDSANKFVLVDAAPVPMKVFKTYINVQGRIDADENVAISTEMPGTITKINVKAGDQVSKGQVLAETDARATQQSLSDLQTNLDLANQMYDKQKALWDVKIGTEVQYLQAKTLKESTEKKMSALQEQLRMSKIISPIDGTIDAVDIKLGQAVQPGIQAIRVINFNNLKVKADLAESYATKVHKGDEVIIRFPDSKDSVVSSVSYSARSISPLNRTFNVEILLDNKREYHPNQIAILNINDYRSEKPTMAIALNYIQKDLKGQHFVLVAEGNKAAKRDVVLGKQYNGTVEITSGLSETDMLITSGYDGLNEGDAIKIKK